VNKTVIKDLHVDLETGDIHVLMHKRVLDDQGNVVVQGNHRVVIHPDTDLDATARVINDHLASGQVPVDHTSGATAKAAPVDLAEWEKVRAHAKLAHTPEVKARWKKQQEARLAEQLIREALARESAAKAQADAETKFQAAVAAAVKAQAA